MFYNNRFANTPQRHLHGCRFYKGLYVVADLSIVAFSAIVSNQYTIQITFQLIRYNRIAKKICSTPRVSCRYMAVKRQLPRS